MIKLGCVLYFEFIQIHHQTFRDKSMISLQKTSSCLLENNTRVLGNNEADVTTLRNNQMSRKYKEENFTSFLKRFSSLVGLKPTLRAGLTLSGPAFSVVRQARGGGGGSEARMPKIKVNIN